MCCLRVSGFLTEITQQIHSLRASGVISSHFARAAGSAMRTFRKSAGTLCTAPAEIPFLVMDFILRSHHSLSPTPEKSCQLLGMCPLRPRYVSELAFLHSCSHPQLRPSVD